MSEFVNNISQFIEGQFPAHFREHIEPGQGDNYRAVLIDFLEAYYEYVEENYPDTFAQTRKMFDYRDIDKTSDEFIQYFENTFLNSLVSAETVDKSFLIKNVIDLYRSKGSEASIKLLIRLLFNEDATVYIPGKDILRASDSEWVDPVYLEVSFSERTKNFVNKRIFGSVSNASAYVQSIITKRVKSRLIDIIYLSNIDGEFIFGDIISDDGILSQAPSVVGSLSRITVDRNNVSNNAVGDVFEVESASGKGATARVTALRNVSGAVEFDLSDGGYGYTLDENTQIFVSDVSILRDNTTQIYSTNDNVRQLLEKIYLDPSEDFADSLSKGDVLVAYDASNTAVSNVVVMETGTEVVGSDINPIITVQLDLGETLLPNQIITFTANAELVINRDLEEGKDITLTLDSSNGTFANGEIVYQREFLDAANTISSRYAYGEVVSANDSVVEITNAFGTFEVDDILTGYTSEAFGEVSEIDITFEGVTGVIAEKITEDSYKVVTANGFFTGTNKVRGSGSKIVAEIANAEIGSATTIQVGSNAASINAVSNAYFTGVVIGQNTTSIAIGQSGNNDFILEANVSTVYNQSDVAVVVEDVASGTGASFKIGSLENTEVINTGIEKIVDTNISDIQFKDILLNGLGSGIGLVSAVNVIDGGSGYTNSSAVTFTGGGYENQDPLIAALGSVVTDANGTIDSITIDEPGEGYFTDASITVADGSGANLEVVMEFGYGFDALPFSTPNTIIGDALTTANLTIGTIASLTEVRKGTGYTDRPFVSIRNPSIAAFSKQDQRAGITNVSRVFVVGETVTSANSDAKGIVLASNSTSVSLRNISFVEDFTVSDVISGSTSGSEATINNINYIAENEIMGRNAVVDNFVVEAEGTIANVEIVNSGVGYLDNESVTLTKEGKVVTGVGLIEKQGRESGYWRTRSSHLNSEKKLHDNNYYQEYSYDIKSGVSLEEYRNILLNIIHVSGTKLFTSIVKSSEEQITVSSESVVTTGV